MIKYWLLAWWLAAFPGTPPPAVLAPPTAMASRVQPDRNNGPVVSGPGGMERLSYRLAETTTNYYHASPSQAENIALAARRLNGTVVWPGRVFSYYATVGPYTAANGFGWGRAFVGDRIVPSVGGGVCQGSSTLYATILRTGLPVIERHAHGLTVPYLPPGEDATVAADYLNFRFRNNRPTPIVITAAAGNRHLTVSVWGATPGPVITVRHKILATYPFKTLVRIDHSLAPGVSKVLAPGQNGVKVESWLEIQSPSGIRIQPLGIDRYRASPRIVESGGPAAPTP